MNEIVDYLIKPYQDYTATQITLEVIAVVFSIISVIYSKKRNILVFPTGLVSTILFSFLLFKWGLYGDMLINVYYTIMSIYGWILWYGKREDEVHVKIESMTRKNWNISAILFIASYIFVLGVYYFRPILSNSFDLSKLAECGPFYTWIDYTDCFTTSIFLVGMYLMAKRKIESWFFWIIGDIISVPMYIEKGFGISAFLYAVLTIIAIYAYFEWRSYLNQQEKHHSIQEIGKI